MERLHEENRRKKVIEDAKNAGMDVKTYMKIRNIKLSLPIDEKNLKVTLEDLEKMNYKDIAENADDDF
jgi:hypothetical protein